MRVFLATVGIAMASCSGCAASRSNMLHVRWPDGSEKSEAWACLSKEPGEMVCLDLVTTVKAIMPAKTEASDDSEKAQEM
jgi:hypothetical protein